MRRKLLVDHLVGASDSLGLHVLRVLINDDALKFPIRRGTYNN